MAKRLGPDRGVQPARLATPSVPETAAQALRNAIISGELKSGERIIEQTWAARFGIGQPTLREALKELEYQGFLVKVPHRGTRVAQLGAGDFRRILEVRLPLEAMAIAKASVNMTSEAERLMKALVSQMAMAGECGDLIRFHECDVAFHREIWRLADNEYLRIPLEALCFRLFVFSVIGRSKEWFRDAVKQHVEILRGLCSRDPDIAQETFLSETVQYWNAKYKLGLAPYWPSPAVHGSPPAGRKRKKL